MCGICGVLQLDGQSVPAHLVSEMRDKMVRRGPDDYGTWCEGQIGLGHRRLSILDLSSAAHQPMVSPDKSAVIVFNGEIYNFRSLRSTLKAKGDEFLSNSDTEVILQAYLRWGEKVVDELDGIFAFALWDKRTKTLLLARDRMGVKPLYYVLDSQRLIFASEVKSILVAKPSCSSPNQKRLYEHLIFRDVSGEETLFADVVKLPPGGLLSASASGIRRTRYWCLPTRSAEGSRLEARELEGTLSATVESQLISDVPVGTLCSGGLDSSLVTAMAQKHLGGCLHTFSVGFPHESCDETRFSLAVSDHLQTEHHVLNASATSFARDLEELAIAHDEPLSHPNSVLIYQICKVAKDLGVTVLLTGEGADELFAGYRHTVVTKRIGQTRRLLGAANCSALAGSLVRIPGRIGRYSAFFRRSDDDIVLFGTAFMAPNVAARLLGFPEERDLGNRMKWLDENHGLTLLERMRQMDLRAYLPPILLRQDKMSMAASVESRVPMLGNTLVSMAAKVPASSLIAKGVGKKPLRDVGVRWLPEDIVMRRKVGFSMPIARWMIEEPLLAERLEAMAARSSPLAQYLDDSLVRQMVAEHRQGRMDHSEVLWILLALYLWLNEYGKNSHASQ